MYRKKFAEKYPTRRAKATIGGYSGFMNKYRNGEIEGEDITSYTNTFAPGFAKRTVKKSRAKTHYQRISDIIRENLKDAIDIIMEESETEDSHEWIQKQFPYMKAVSTLYIDSIIRRTWTDSNIVKVRDEISSSISDPFERFEAFKTALRKKPLKDWFDNVLSSSQAESIINDHH